MALRIWLETHKPAASQRLHLMLAASMWTIVGTLLLIFGLTWVIRSDEIPRAILIVLAVAVGVVKSRWILDRTAWRIISRIHARGDNRCVGGFLSMRTCLLVAVMASAGRWLRGGALSLCIVGPLYIAVGVALVLSARRLWIAWYGHRKGRTS